MLYPKKYEVKISHFYCMEYIEGEKKMTVDIDFRDTIIYLNVGLIEKWDYPYQNEILNYQKKEEIIKNIWEYLVDVRKFKNVVLEI